ncbi:hypothetical protein PPYR_00406 [Photinus pyralis]|uniref:Zinc finger PHD-type domain-containing protein n=2 Tax=Photinus pyralis TaxID=7054 RepID=A0A5N4B1K4_PHOPY|nr:uncharacterized protein LOC116167592 [Photinus pyralis]KAB0803436.1 hypothetical protein PPYR_00406 [Photinus pyralis]
MPKREYGKWSSETMKRALSEYEKNDIGFNECCRKYEIPKPTFRRHLLGQVKRGNDTTHQAKRRVNGRELALPEEVERQLVEHILKFEELLFGLTINDVRKLAYDILAANPHIPNPFNKETKMAGKKWYYAFLARHPNISLRQPENVSIARCKGFNKTNVYNFFDILENVVDENGIDGFHIYNVDESGFSTVQKKAPKVLASKGKHQVGFVASGERGINTTLVCCVNATGNYVPPMFIFKRLRMHPALKNGCFPGSIVETSESGYINSQLFVLWLKHFIKFVKPSPQEKCLLLLDGHTTHSKNLEAIKLSREHGIILLQLPGHTTHRLQPLDVGVFKSMESNYTQVMAKWLRTNPGQKVTQFEVTALLTEAFTRSATIDNAVNGFRGTGTWPVNRNVFTDADFVASENLDHQSTNPEPEHTVIEENNVSNSSGSKIIQHVLDEPSTSGLNHEELAELNKRSSLKVSIAEISPIPRPTKKHDTRIRKGAQKAAILTESPYKKELELKQKEKEKKEEKSRSNKQKAAAKKEKVNKNIADKENVKPKQPVIIIETNEEDWYCSLCNESIIEDMIQCMQCRKWAHEMCAGVHVKSSYICDLCS